MIYRKGQALEYWGKTYTVGDVVIANADSVYEGLIGRITEIRTDGDKETDNLAPDVYCDFEKPQFPFARDTFKRKYGIAVDENFDWDMVALSAVIMAPEMLILEEESGQSQESISICVLLEECCMGGEAEEATYAFLDIQEVERTMLRLTYKSKESGAIYYWQQDGDKVIETFDGCSYLAYVDGDSDENYYKLFVLTINIPMTPSNFEIVKKAARWQNER